MLFQPSELDRVAAHLAQEIFITRDENESADGDEVNIQTVMALTGTKEPIKGRVVVELNDCGNKVVVESLGLPYFRTQGVCTQNKKQNTKKKQKNKKTKKEKKKTTAKTKFMLYDVNLFDKCLFLLINNTCIRMNLWHSLHLCLSLYSIPTGAPYLSFSLLSPVTCIDGWFPIRVALQMCGEACTLALCGERESDNVYTEQQKIILQKRSKQPLSVIFAPKWSLSDWYLCLYYLAGSACMHVHVHMIFLFN